MSENSKYQLPKATKLSSIQEFRELVHSFPKRYLFIGSGPRLQFAHPTLAVDEVIAYLRARDKQPILIIFGGDTADPQHPDLGYLIQQVKIRLVDTVKVLAVQSWSEYCPFVDYIFQYPRTFCERSHQELWGGVQNGLPIAATYYYLNEYIQKVLTALVCIGGGEIAKQELAYVIKHKILSYHYIRAEVRHHREFGLYGPTYEWYNTLQKSLI